MSTVGLHGRRLLVTGGAGFIGSNLVRRALAEGCARVVVVDNFLSSEPGNLPGDPRLEVRTGSAADEAMLASLEGELDLVFHLATYHGNQSSMVDPLADHANSLLPTLKLLEGLKRSGRMCRLVYASTGCALAAKVTDDATPVIEEGPVPLDFDSPYQISKVAGEMYAVYYHRVHSVPVVRARFQNVYGPSEVLGAGRWRGTPATIWRNVVPTFVYRALKKQPLPLHDGGRGVRDFIYVDDVVEGLVRCATTAGIEGDVFNLASGVPTSIADLAGLINELTGNMAGVEWAPAREWDRSIARVGDPAKAAHRLDFRARVALRGGLERTVAWTVENLERIERCIRSHRRHCPVEF